ncbi:MAG: hypothetical protein CL928_17780 [Deltaproteobacteria bacterium]|nr:hypothetical protein [Deltaproteobacteria bacterium]
MFSSLPSLLPQRLDPRATKDVHDWRPEARRADTTGAVVLCLALWLPGCQNTWEPTGETDELPPSLVGIGIGPDHAVVPLGEQLQFQATGYYSDQSARDLTDIVSWQTWRDDVLHVSSSLDQEGLGTPVDVGYSRIRALYNGLQSNEIRAAVTDAYPTQLTVAPGALSLHQDQTLQLTAEAAFSDGHRGNVSGTVRWVVERASVATVGATGQVTSRGVGTTTVQAIYENGDSPVEAEPVVINVVPDSVPVEPADLHITSVYTTVTEETVSWTVDIENQGGTAAAGIWVDAWLDRSSSPSAPTAGDGYAVISLLEPGEQQDVVIELSGVTEGTYSSWVLVDSLAAIYEGHSGDDNNDWGPENVSVGPDSPPATGPDNDCDTTNSSTCVDWEEGENDTGSTDPSTDEDTEADPGDNDESATEDEGPSPHQGVDLAVTYFEGWSLQEPDEVLYFIDVTNHGDTTAEMFGVGVLADVDEPPSAPSQPDSLVEVDQLLPGETAYLSAVVPGAPDPTWWSFVLADVASAIDETNESNNQDEWLVTP